LALTPGTRLGPYEVTAQIGVGGMGEVYRATDTNLKRAVAIKVLPESVAADAERLARFQREAEVLASLNHPHIAAIYGLERSDATTALVMELVEGPTLADRIAQGPIPVDETLPIAKQIAEALEAAHEHRIIHRDLKPANVKVREDGTVKVLDFGLAKALEPTDAMSTIVTQSPTITSPAMMTGMGVILGTAAYMSPEQAKGRQADKRSDIWAFGCVLYEMLTGQRAFPGDDVADTVATVLKGEPDWNALSDDVPEHIRLLLRRTLEKDRNRRVADISIARFLITEPVVGASRVTTSVQATIIAPPRSLLRRALPLGFTAIVTTGMTAAVMWNMRPSTVPPIVRFSIELPERQQFAVRSQVLAVSPDGSQIVYVAGGGQLYLRSMPDINARPIPGTNLDVMSPVFSPDGQWIVFFSFQDSTLKKIAITGGTPSMICKADPPFGLTWDRDWIVFADQGSKGILRVSSQGGEPEVLAAVHAGEVFGTPQMLNDGSLLLFTVATGQENDRWDRAQIVVQSVGSSERTVILRGASEGQYVRTGHLVFTVGRTLRASPFDVKALQLRGSAVPIVEGVRRFPANIQSPVSSFAVSAGGTFAYIQDSALTGQALQTVALASRDGKLQPLDLPAKRYSFPRVSPDGKQLAIQTNDGIEATISIYDLKGAEPARRLTFGGRNIYPLWTPDGRRITFQSDREGDRGIFWQLADGTGAAERLTKPDSLLNELRPETWSPDGKTLALSGSQAPEQTRVFNVQRSRTFTLAADGAQALKPVFSIPARFSTFSPDGKWLAYTSTEIGNREEIFVQPFPPTGAQFQISTEGARTPLWSPDGKQLYYYANLSQRFVAVDVRTQPTFGSGKAVALPIEALFNSPLARNYDVTPDGKQFVVITPAVASTDSNRSSTPQINVVLNWYEELKRLVPTK
jgi:eukaryotic-like serine/threonine-protein kinase